MTCEDIASMKRMSDVNLLACLKILTLLSYILRDLDNKFLPMIGSRILQLTHNHGLSVFSTTGLIILGHVLSSKGDKVGLKFGKLAMKICENAPNQYKEIVPGMQTQFYGGISPWFESVHDSLEPLLKAYAMALECGNNLASRRCSCRYIMLAFDAGKSIVDLLSETDDLKDTTQNLSPIVAATLQMLLNLSGSYNDLIATISGDEFDISTFDDSGILDTRPSVYLLATINAYIVGDFSLALQYVESCTSQCLSPLEGSILHPIQNFYAGLVLLAIGKQSGKQDYVYHAKGIIDRLRDISKHSPKNFLNKVHMLEAEIAVVSGDKKQAIANFEQCILLSKENMFKNEEAIACERAGVFFLANNEVENGLRFLSQACVCYKEWGATAKVEQLMKKYPSLKIELKDKPISDLVVDSESFMSIENTI